MPATRLYNVEMPLPYESVLDLLACPVCHQRLSPAADAVSCTSCGREYPIVDGIPILLADRARTKA